MPLPIIEVNEYSYPGQLAKDPEGYWNEMEVEKNEADSDE